MTDAEAHSVQRQTGRRGFTTDAERDDAVAQLAGALRSAQRAHGAYRAELRLGDVEPVEDWATWYAEYLLGQR